MKYILLAYALCIITTPVFAGFEWVSPPPDQQQDKLKDRAQKYRNMPAPMERGIGVPVEPVNLMPQDPVSLSPARQIETLNDLMEAPMEVPADSAQYQIVQDNLGQRNIIQKAPNLRHSPEAEKVSKTQQSFNQAADSEQNEELDQTLSSYALPKVDTFEQNIPNADNIEGFGRDLPLVIALQQIVPSHYAYSFGPGIDLDAKVNWLGGQPWTHVLKNMLAEQGLEAALINNNKAIRIIRNFEPISQKALELPEITTEIAASENKSGTMSLSSTRKSPEKMNDNTVITAFYARAGNSFQDTLKLWSKQADVKFQTQQTYDFILERSYSFETDFTDAVDQFLSEINTSAKSGNGPSRQFEAQLRRHQDTGQVTLILQG